METRIRETMNRIDDAGGMYSVAEQGVIQSWLGQSAVKFQNRVESGEQLIAGVNKHADDEQQAISVRPPQDTSCNLFETIVEAVIRGLAHGGVAREIRNELGEGKPLVVP